MKLRNVRRLFGCWHALLTYAQDCVTQTTFEGTFVALTISLVAVDEEIQEILYYDQLFKKFITFFLMVNNFINSN